MKHVRRALSIIGLIVFCYIIIGQFVFPANAPDLGAQCEEMPRDNWFVVNEDGTRERIILPSTADSDIVLETTIPEDVGYDKDALWIRGKDMEVYVDNELRTKYEIDDYSILTDRSSDCFIMVSVYPQDAGKTLRINYSYNRGNVYTVFLGNRMGILKHLLGEYGAELFVGFAVLLLGGMSYFAALGYQIIYRKYLELRDLSFAVLLGGIWVIYNSVFRQIFARNVSVMSDTPFLVVLIMPFPLLVFFDSLQKRRHTKVISVVEVLGVINAVVCLTLFVTGVAEISKIFIIAGLYVIIAIVVMGYTMISDVVHRQIESYKYVAIGFGLFEMAVIIQIILYLSVTNGMFTGTVVAFGLLGFLIFAILHTIKELIIMSKETDDAKRSVKVKDEFLANMSHEIRTPLNGILGMNEMILRDTREPSTKKYAVNIKGAGNVLLTLINDILDLSKIEAG
ncbi:MAG: hypothetical protein K5644_08365, partial [Lachnospiraceae bacterium]|nr:hypothetical protein [Lachnospiraceae bacterium]